MRGLASMTNSTKIDMTATSPRSLRSLRIISKLLCNSHHFFRGRDSQPHLVPSVFPQTLHPITPRCRRNLRRLLVAHNQLANLVVQLHHRENPHPRSLSHSRTALTPRPADGRHFLSIRHGSPARRRHA